MGYCKCCEVPLCKIWRPYLHLFWVILNFSKKISTYQWISIDIKRKLKKLNLGPTGCHEIMEIKLHIHFDNCNNLNVEFSYLYKKIDLKIKFLDEIFLQKTSRKISIDINWYFCFLDKILEKVKISTKT